MVLYFEACISAKTLTGMSAPVPDLYYLDNFRLLMRHACSTYGDLLADREHAFLATFAGLGLPAQCLYVRLLTRRGPQVRADHVRYAEIVNVPAVAEELAAAGMICIDANAPAQELLAMLTLPELRPLAVDHGLLTPADVRTKRKPELIELLAAAGDEACTAALREHWHWYRCEQRDIVDTLLLLFFGNRQQDLSVFVLAELGLLRFENYSLDDLRQFADRDDFDAYRNWLDRSDAVYAAIDAGDIESARALADVCLAAQPHRVAPLRRVRLLKRLSRFFERQGDIAAALVLADACVGAGIDSSVDSSVDSGIDASIDSSIDSSIESEEAAHRARLMRARHGLIVGSATAGKAQSGAPIRPRRARPLAVVERALQVAAWQPGGAEQLVLDRLINTGCSGAHWENHFPCALFGLLCWDILFSPVVGAFFNAYQAAPADLYSGAFRARRGPALQTRLSAIAGDHEDWRTRLVDTYTAKQGVTNAFVAWRHVPLQPLRELCAALPSPLAAGICERLCTDPRRYRRGFPDLSLLTSDGKVQFCEVKSPNDQLSLAQRDWLGFLRSFGTEAWVARLVTTAASAASKSVSPTS